MARRTKTLRWVAATQLSPGRWLCLGRTAQFSRQALPSGPGLMQSGADARPGEVPVSWCALLRWRSSVCSCCSAARSVPAPPGPRRRARRGRSSASRPPGPRSRPASHSPQGLGEEVGEGPARGAACQADGHEEVVSRRRHQAEEERALLLQGQAAARQDRLQGGCPGPGQEGAEGAFQAAATARPPRRNGDPLGRRRGAGDGRGTAADPNQAQGRPAEARRRRLEVPPARSPRARRARSRSVSTSPLRPATGSTRRSSP